MRQVERADWKILSSEQGKVRADDVGERVKHLFCGTVYFEKNEEDKFMDAVLSVLLAS